MTKPAANEGPATELVVPRVVVLVECGLPKDTGGSAGARAEDVGKPDGANRVRGDQV